MESGLVKVKRELAEVKMERDLLKKLWRTLPRKSGKVRNDRTTTGGLPRAAYVPDLCGISLWLLCLAGSLAFKADAGRLTPSVGSQNRTAAYTGDFMVQSDSMMNWPTTALTPQFIALNACARS